MEYFWEPFLYSLRAETRIVLSLIQDLLETRTLWDPQFSICQAFGDANIRKKHEVQIGKWWRDKMAFGYGNHKWWCHPLWHQSTWVYYLTLAPALILDMPNWPKHSFSLKKRLWSMIHTTVMNANSKSRPKHNFTFQICLRSMIHTTPMNVNSKFGPKDREKGNLWRRSKNWSSDARRVRPKSTRHDPWTRPN